ncbi:MAG: hypothetical protein ACREID_07460, partial [Planctomycetota bacterium]
GAEALDFYRKSLRADPGLDDAAYRFQGLIANQEDFDQAEKLYEELVKLAPGNGLIHNNFGLRLRDWAEPRGAQKPDPPTEVKRKIRRSSEVYEIAARLLPEDAQIQSDTGLLFEFYPCIRDDDKAQSYFTRSLELSDYCYRDAFDGLARLCRRAGRWQILQEYAANVIDSLDNGGQAIAPVSGSEPQALLNETPGLRARAEAALREAEGHLKR